MVYLSGSVIYNLQNPNSLTNLIGQSQQPLLCLLFRFRLCSFDCHLSIQGSHILETQDGIVNRKTEVGGERDGERKGGGRG